jgi:hypothetical protein
LITTEGSKTLSALYRNIVGDPCSKSAADTFREAPWEADDIRITLRGFLVRSGFDIAEAEDAPRAVFLSLVIQLLRQFLTGYECEEPVVMDDKHKPNEPKPPKLPEIPPEARQHSIKGMHLPERSHQEKNPDGKEK